MFRDPLNGDFRLQEGSPCKDRGYPDENLILSYDGKAPDIGAWEGTRLVDGPAFRYFDPPAEVPYKEHSRISKYSVMDNELTLWFSIPVSEEELQKAQFSLLDSGAMIPLSLVKVEDEGFCYIFSCEQKIDTGSGLKLYLYNWPIGVNGMEICGWASAIPVLKTQ